MIKGSEKREAGYPVDKIFVDRWSPRAMTGEGLPEEELMTLFEAARWAPSSYNNQPWRILYARRDTEHWPLFLGLLVEGNRAWAKDAAALLLFVSKTTFDFNGETYPTYSFDTGAAWENLALQATLKGLVAHGMQGFDYETARKELEVPDNFDVMAMIAIGKRGPKDKLPEDLQNKELPNGRKPLSEIVMEGMFRN